MNIRPETVGSTGAANPISFSSTTYEGRVLDRVEFKWNAAPTTSENIVINRDSAAGSTYDTNLITYDPSSVSGTTSLIWPKLDATFEKGDKLTITYTNTDDKTIGVSIYWRI